MTLKLNLNVLLRLLITLRVLIPICIVYVYPKQGDPGVRGPMGNPGKEGPKVGKQISVIVCVDLNDLLRFTA